MQVYVRALICGLLVYWLELTDSSVLFDGVLFFALVAVVDIVFSMRICTRDGFCFVFDLLGYVELLISLYYANTAV